MRLKEEKYVIGLMSGTSLDGLDIVYVKFLGDKEYEVVCAVTYSYPETWMKVLKNVSLIEKGDVELKRLDVSLGRYFAERLSLFINDYSIKKVDFIASHGHTVHHVPEENYTLQIGSGQEMYDSLSIPVVYNFREQDVLLGGQGAPLVPVGDELLFGEYDYCLNLGGFSNISYQENGVRKAYDICPVNTVLNYYAQKIGFEYDDKGNLARKGRLDVELFDKLNGISYYQQDLPKSLGVEFLKTDVFPLLERSGLSEKDVLRTFVEHVAYQIASSVSSGSLLVTGGGAYHEYLLERIEFFNKEILIEVPSKKLVEFKEALIFAYLGKLRFERKDNCLASVTGASKNHSSGVVII